MYSIVDNVLEDSVVEYIIKFWFENKINYICSHFPKGLCLWVQIYISDLSIWKGNSVVWIKKTKFI